LHLYWEGGDGERLPAYATRVVQDEKTRLLLRSGLVTRSCVSVARRHIGMAGPTKNRR